MRLSRARVSKYRSIRDTGWFEVETKKSILVGPNEAGKTALLRALHQLNPPEDTPGFDALRDYPRSEHNDIDSGKVDPSDVTVVEGRFSLDDNDRAAIGEIDADFEGCTYVKGRRLDNTWWHRVEDGPNPLTYSVIKKDLKRLVSHIDKRAASHKPEDDNPVPKRPGEALDAIVAEWPDDKVIDSGTAAKLKSWLENTALEHVDESNETEENRYDKLLGLVEKPSRREAVLKLLSERVPVFVYYNNYFRVRPRLHLRHLANRIKSGVLDDDEYDYGNKCLLKLLGFTARELSDLGAATDPDANNGAAMTAYQDQLDKRDYKLNAASVRLTQEIRGAWQPDAKTDEAATLRMKADQQYLKVVVEDELGVEVELDQRSEGFQWLVSFFVVFFAEAADEYENAILLLDEPGLSLHGLKQREFRKTISRLSTDNQLLFTTHSPFLVGPDELDFVRVVEMPNRKAGTKVHTKVTSENPASLLPLQEALGYDLAQSLFSQQRNLVMEGLTDYWYVAAVALLLADAGLIALNEKIALVPANTAGKVVYFATILHAHNLKVAALLDSDAAGEKAAKQEVLVHTLGNKRILRTKDSYSGRVSQPEIEDLLRDTLIAVAKEDLGWDVASTAAKQSTRPIIDVFSEVVGDDFSKYRLAKAFIRWSRRHEASDLSDSERADWKELIETINKALK